jgi:uncharacterized protein (TIGR02466 family)
MKSEIITIFPTPVYRTSLNREITKKELLFINKVKLNTHKGDSNKSSNDTYILNNKIFKNLKEEINLSIKEYFIKIIEPVDNISFYITQSWLNYTDKNEFHPRHEHPNSLVSGVFYINANEKFDKISFYKDRVYEPIKITPKKWNIFNSTLWWIPVKKGDLILFPSSLSHMVETKETDNTRISLAFNVFIKGRIGDKRELTELYL